MMSRQFSLLFKQKIFRRETCKHTVLKSNLCVAEMARHVKELNLFDREFDKLFS